MVPKSGVSIDTAMDVSPSRTESPYGEQTHLIDLYEDASIDPVYQAKARVLNRAIQDIGMGRYQVSS